MDYNVSYRKKDKGIQCIISYKDNDGKWRQKSKQGFERQKDAKPWIKDTVERLEETIKVPIDYRNLTFSDFKKIFLHDKRKYSQNTLTMYEYAYMWLEDLDDIRLSDIGYINIKPCVDKMIDSNRLKNSTIEAYLTKLVATLNHAIEKYQILETNPVKIKQYEMPKEERDDKINALNESQLNDLLSKLDGKDYYICLIAAKCGLRIGEIIGLTDTSLNFNKSEIEVSKQWKKIDKDGNYGFGALKSDNSYRSTPIPRSYVHELKEYVDDCVIGIDRRIFPENKTHNVSARLWGKFRKLGYEISIHDLRHTYATTLLFNGFDYKTVAELLGDTVETVISAYSHFIDDMYVSAKNRIDNIL